MVELSIFTMRLRSKILWTDMTVRRILIFWVLTRLYSGFITIDGLLLILNTDVGAGACSTVDVNGPDSGPNIEGRDVFSICLVEGQYEEYCGNIWGFTKECIIKNFGIESGISNCFGIGTGGDSGVTCGARLIKEGKMTY